MVGLNVFRVGLYLHNYNVNPDFASFVSLCKRMGACIVATIIAVMLLGGAQLSHAADIDSGHLYVKVGDVVTHIPIIHLKEKSNPQIIDVISGAVERAISDNYELTPDQIQQAVSIARSMTHADEITSRVQIIYAQAQLTNIDIETLVRLDNVFAADELMTNKMTKSANFGISMYAQENKPSAGDIN
ncbi:MAG: hypothetical protein HOH48_01300 [Candidatus Puniceispirillum sp.]|jgi:hypothetical protein|uniref:hypothetical protein n=1 Tax=uncultured Candidatus Puniceispirillum sp. TaxID=1985115 RepID=UPI002A71A871|nr:hypothetical protein [Candidatus Puniceispirillum sp.]MBT6565816.1 hypothetical protein [Candidatus Puniceispirillum sp.]